MYLRPAGETRIFHEGQGGILRPLPPSHHPKWSGLFLAGKAHPKTTTATARRKKRHSRRNAVIAAVSAGLVLAALAGIYSALNVHRIKHGVSISSISLSGKTETEARSLLQKSADNFTVSLLLPGQAPATPAQLGLKFNIDATMDRARQAGSLNPFGSKQLSFDVTLDEKVLDAYLLKSANKVRTAPVNAKLSITTDGLVEVTPDKKGKSYGIDPSTAKTLILEAARNGQPAVLKPADFESEATFTAANLAEVKKQAEQTIATPVSLSIDGHPQKTTSAQVASWITIIVDEPAKKVTADVDAVKVSAYLDGLAKAYIKPPRAKVVVRNEDGTTRVLSEGAPGTDIIDKKAVAAELSASLNQRQQFTKALPVAYADPQTITAGDYDKWIDVDLTNKRMYAYEHGTVDREFLISAGAPATPTVKGQFAIKSKVRMQDMRGFNADGSRYYQPNVEYINYFYADYAIHGNYWRALSSFGHTNLSHGCVGITNTDAKWMYNWAPVGTPVIIHD